MDEFDKLEEYNKLFEEYQKLLEKKQLRLKQVVRFDNNCKELDELEELIKKCK